MRLRPALRDATLGVLALGLASTSALAQDVEKEAVEAIVREYILANPEIVQEALDLLEQRATEAERMAQVAAIEKNHELLTNSPHQMVLGNPEGSVTMVEFFDYNCSFCRRAMDDMLDLIAEEPDLRVVLKEFPVLGPGSLEAARVSAALTLNEPDLYLDFHRRLLDAQGPVDEAAALRVAEAVGADMDLLRATLERPEVMNGIREAYALADAFGMNGTPSYVIGDEVIIGAVGFDALRTSIENAKEMSDDAGEAGKG